MIMKNEATAVATLEKFSPEMTVEHHQVPADSLQDVFDFLEKNKGKIHFPEKYFKGQKENVIARTETLYLKDPKMPLRQIIRKVLKSMPDFLTGENLVQVVTYITETWAKCQAELNKETAEAAVPAETEAVF